MKAASSPFCLTVLSGANAGAMVPLAAGKTVIGGTAADEIILDGALSGQLAVTLHGERVRLEAAAAGVSVGDSIGTAEPLRPGQHRILALPVMVRLNDDAQLNIARRAPVHGRLVPAAVAALATMVALAGGLLVGLQMPDSVRAASEMTAQAAPSPAPVRQPALADTVAPRQPTAPLRATSPMLGPCDATCRKDAQARLREQLNAAGLSGLALATEGDVLRVTGALTDSEEQRWRSLRRDFETTYGGSLPLLVSIGEGSGAPMLAVSSIWLGPRPELRTRSGEVLRIGDRTGDGWTVKTIARGAITLSRDGTETVVHF